MKKIYILISLFILLSTTALIIILDQKEVPQSTNGGTNTNFVPSDIVRLTSPTKLNVTNGVLTWESVPNASGYIVTLGNKEYQTTLNMMNISSYEIDNVKVTVRSVGTGTYLSSINSIARYYIKDIDEDAVKELAEKLQQFLNKNLKQEISTSLKKLTEELAEELYLEGVTIDSIDHYIGKINEFVEFVNSNEYNSDALSKILYKLIDNDLSDFANVLMIKNMTILILEQYKTINSNDHKFDLFLEEIKNLSDYDIERVSITVRYLRDVAELIVEQSDEIVNQILLTLKNDVKLNSAVEIGYDFIVLKDQLIENVLLEMPLQEEYEFSINLLSNLYGSIIPKSMSKYNLVDIFKYLFDNFYLSQHRIVNFIKFFDNEHFKHLTKILKTLYNSMGGETFDNNVLELYELYQQEEYDKFLSTILKYGFTKNGQLDLDNYNKLKDGLTKLNKDILDENYEYLEKPLTDFFTELFKYLKDEHDLEIILNPLIAYLTEDGSYITHLLEQFNILNYIKIVEGKEVVDLYSVIKTWDESDWKIIKSLETENIQEIFEKLGLTDIIEIDLNGWNDLMKFEFIDHVTKLFDDISVIVDIKGKIDYLFKHFDFNEKILPLIQELLVELDDEYGLNIDYSKFLVNLLTSMGVDITLTLLNVNELSNYLTHLQKSFEIQYEKPNLEVGVFDSELIKTALKENLIYFLFGMDSVELQASIDQLKDKLPEIVQYLETMYGDIKVEDIINILETIEIEELLKDYNIESKYIEELEKVIDEFIKMLKEENG